MAESPSTEESARADFGAGTSYAIEKQWLIQNGELFVLTEYGFREPPSIW
jgi:hypothetical protein